MKKLFAVGILAAVLIGFSTALLVISGPRVLLEVLALVAALFVIAIPVAWAMHTLRMTP